MIPMFFIGWESECASIYICIVEEEAEETGSAGTGQVPGRIKKNMKNYAGPVCCWMFVGFTPFPAQPIQQPSRTHLVHVWTPINPDPLHIFKCEWGKNRGKNRRQKWLKRNQKWMNKTVQQLVLCVHLA